MAMTVGLNGIDIGDHPVAHVLPRLQGRGSQMGQQDDVGVAQQAGVDRRLVLIDVQADARDDLETGRQWLAQKA